MGKKEDLLEELFQEWEEKQHNESEESLALTISGSNITKDHFRRDGIINENVFEKENRKILFISAEANDDDYSAEHGIIKTNTVEDYRKYAKTGIDDYKGKMRVRTSALYKIAAGIDKHSITDAEATLHYAFMDLNKRGGTSTIDKGLHIKKYCEIYKKYIIREIEIISPDIIVWLSTKTFDMGIPKILGAVGTNPKSFVIEQKRVPIIRMWHTAYRYGKKSVTPLEGYNDDITASLCAKLQLEMRKYGLLGDIKKLPRNQNESEQPESLKNFDNDNNKSVSPKEYSIPLTPNSYHNYYENSKNKGNKTKYNPKMFIGRKILDWFLFILTIMCILACFGSFKRSVPRTLGSLVSLTAFLILVMPIPSILNLWEKVFGNPRWLWIRTVFLILLFIIAIMFVPGNEA